MDLRGLSVNIAKRGEAMANNSNELSFAQRVLQDMNSGVLVLSKQGKIIYSNKPARKMLELSDDDERNEDFFASIMDITKQNDIKEADYNDDFNEYIFQSVYSRDVTHNGRVKYMTPNGYKRVFVMSSSFLENNEDSEQSQIVITLCDVTKEEEMKIKFRDSSTIFSVFLIGICGWLTLYALWEAFDRPFSKKIITHGVEVLGLILLVIIIRFSSLRWRDIGLFGENTKKTWISTLILCIIAFAVLTTIKIIFRNNSGVVRSGPFIDFSVMDANRWFYIVTAFVQEFLARGCVQSNLKRISASRHPSLIAIIMASLVFAVLHIHLGVGFMIGAALLGGVLGIVYDRQETIYGVWIIHWFTGTMAALMGVFYT